MLIVNCRFLSQKTTGTQKFASEICKELKKQDKNVIFLSNPNILQEDIAKKLNVKIIGKKSYKWFKFFKLPSGLLWEQIILPFYIQRYYKNATLLNLINLAPIFYKKNAVVLYDVSFKKYPHFFKKIFLIVYNTLIPIILKRAKIIFTVSEFSKSEIVKFFNINKNKINVIYSATDKISDKKKKENIKKEKYILAVGSLEPRKNIVKLIEAITNQNNIKLIIVGEQNSKVFNMNIKIQPKHNIIFTGYVNDQKLNNLYKNATSFIYPSIYEGFGMPPLEAQSFGVPVIVSDIDVFHEIYGDSVFYINPYDKQNILNGIQKVMNDKNLQSELIEKGYKNIEKYSWEKSARKIFHNIIEAPYNTPTL